MSAPTIEKPVTATASTQFAIHRADWFGILDDVLPFAGTDSYIPLLQNVQVRVSESGLITAATTDRFTIGRRVYQLQAYESDAVEILLPLTVVKDLRRIHAPTPRGSSIKASEITVQINARQSAKDGGSAVAGSITVTSREGRVSSSHDGFVGDFVDTDKFFEATEFAGVDRIAWNPELMARFAKVKGATSNTVIRFQSALKPIRIDIGDQFSGLVMPARLPRDAA